MPDTPKESTMTDTTPLTDQQLADIARRGQHPSQCPAETIRHDYTDLLAEAEQLRAELATAQEERKAARVAFRRLKAGLIASADLLDEPFTNAPTESPWTRLKTALHVLDCALKYKPPADPTADPAPTT